MFEEAAIRYKGSVQLAVVDHITSPSAMVMPIRKIANKLRPLGVLILVDGAHAPGQGIWSVTSNLSIRHNILGKKIDLSSPE